MIRLLFHQNGGKIRSNRGINNILARNVVSYIGNNREEPIGSALANDSSNLHLGNYHGHVSKQSTIIKRTKSSMPIIEANINENTTENTSSTSHLDSYKEEIKKNKALSKEINRLIKMRNVGVFAHVDAGKTTVTERMITLAGFVNTAGSVDNGNTVTDYLPMERERGISIQSAAISFDWAWHTQKVGQDNDDQDEVNIHLIDTPGHVDFSVEVNRSVAVLDGAVLVVDAVAGVQAQTYTVWKAISQQQGDFSHEALPCVAVINKMDKEEANFEKAMETMRNRLPSANPIALHLPLFRSENKVHDSCLDDPHIFAVCDASVSGNGNFAGVIDIVHMRAIIWPDIPSNKLHIVEHCIPKVINLNNADCPIYDVALQARHNLIEQLANIDPAMEECFLLEESPSNAEMRNAIRRVTLERKAVPVLAAAALKAKGIEPVLDSIADYLPSPLDRLPPALSYMNNNTKKKDKPINQSKFPLMPGHPLHSSLIAFAFKVVHLKGRGGSGDGRVVFVRVYSGSLKTKDAIKVISSTSNAKEKARAERVSGMLQLNPSGRYANLDDGICRSGDVAALVGLKNVKTGDTIHLASGTKVNAYLAGVSSPKPVLTIRIEAQNTQDETKLASALQLLTIEDPSLHISQDPDTNATLLSGLGELHVEIILDRLMREFGLQVNTGPPAVAYKETLSAKLDTMQRINYDRTFGNVRMQASMHFIIEPVSQSCTQALSHIFPLSDPIVTIEPKARQFLQIKDNDISEDQLYYTNDLVKSLIMGCVGTLKRGVIGPYPMANVHCRVVDIDSELGYKGLFAAPNTLRAASSQIISNVLKDNKGDCNLLEPIMSMEVMSPRSSVGTVLNDFVKRRGNVDDVFIPDESWNSDTSMAMIRGNVPLKEILGYANSLRSVTNGEGTFTAEYLGHTTFNEV